MGGGAVLLVPGLDTLDPGLFEPQALTLASQGLCRWLRRAAVEPGPGTLEELLTGSACSLAEYAYLGDLGRTANGQVLCASPIHLRADMEAVHLYGPEVLAITGDEARALIAAFNALYADEGLCLEMAHPESWYLHLRDDQPLPSCPPLARLRGRPLPLEWVQGEAAGPWMRHLNEVQMLFHEQPCNQARAESGRPRINGLWLWGAQRPGIDGRWSAHGPLRSEDALLRGWARATGREAHPNAPGGRLQGLNHLPAIERHQAYGEVDELLAALRQLGQLLETAGPQARLWPLNGLGYRQVAWRRIWPRRGALPALLQPPD